MEVYPHMSRSTTIPFPATPAVPSVGWGFSSLSTPSTSNTNTPPLAPRANPPPTPTRNPTSSNKRRHEADPDQEDENMSARSPSPIDRPKRGLAKRVRVDVPKANAPPPSTPQGGKPASEPADAVDVGLMLASLPPASHLTILTSLIAKHPGLKNLILPLIPRPTLDAAVQAINAAAKKIRDAHPYSQQPAPPPPSIGFGFGFGSSISAGTSAFGGYVPSPSSTPNASRTTTSTQSGMRDGYVQSRLRPVVADFASTARSYLSYFTLDPSGSASSSSSTPSSSPSTSASPHPIAEQIHPSDTFIYLHTLTVLILRLSPQALGLLVKEHDALLVRVQTEWRAWLDRIDTHVNRSGGMYGSETVRTWERGLDELVGIEADMPPLSSFAASDDESGEGARRNPPASPPPPSRSSASSRLLHGSTQSRALSPSDTAAQDKPMRALRDAWVTRVGWLIGRRVVMSVDGMDEDI